MRIQAFLHFFICTHFYIVERKNQLFSVMFRALVKSKNGRIWFCIIIAYCDAERC